ncbi:hypothetical protein MMC12_003970 [Toensbergia leucococca]|nr:hypothetical protein [Toensbergia leucococca]
MIGLQNAGKTSLLRVLAGGEFTIDSIPTVGFNMKRVQRGHVTLKCWDLGGQPRFRSMWERYCRGVNAIVYIVDAADKKSLPIAEEELHALLEKPVLDGIPLLVLGNKSDLPEKLSVDELIDALNLKDVSHREVSCYGISAKEETNLDAVLQWLIKRSSNCYNDDGFYGNYCNSAWDNYGRWIILAIIVIAAFLIFFLLACVTARRRRARGQQPWRGTGFLVGNTPPGHAPAQYTGDTSNTNQYQNGSTPAGAAPPIYSPPANQTYYGNGNGNPNQGYFGGQQSGIELQQPQGAYQPQRGGDPVYSPPAGPPPSGMKSPDGIIR